MGNQYNDINDTNRKFELIIIHMSSIFIWIGNPNPRVRVAGGRMRFFVLTNIFWKGTFWNPQSPLATFQACRRRLYFFVCVPFLKVCFICLTFVYNVWSIFDNGCQYLSIYGTAYLPTMYIMVWMCTCIYYVLLS